MSLNARAPVADKRATEGVCGIGGETRSLLSEEAPVT